MQRAMQTAIHMFKGHPNLANIKFIVEPLIHEIMHTMNDICMDADQLQQKYAPGQEICHGLNFDFSRLSANHAPNLWMPETIIVPSKKAAFYEKLQQRGNEPTYENV